MPDNLKSIRVRGSRIKGKLSITDAVKKRGRKYAMKN